MVYKKTVAIRYNLICKENKPVYGAKGSIIQLRNSGWHVVIMCDRAQIGASQWLKDNEMPFDEVTYAYPVADCYVDSRAIRHHNWVQTIRDINLYGTIDYSKGRR